MGMYTELFLQVPLKEDTPEGVINTLKYMLGNESVGEPEAPFTADRWSSMLRCSSYYHYPFSHSHLDYVSWQKQYFLFVRCDFKNYTGELEGFLNWIAPWVDGQGGYYEGHHMYEEQEEPTRIRFCGGSVDY